MPEEFKDLMNEIAGGEKTETEPENQDLDGAETAEPDDEPEPESVDTPEAEESKDEGKPSVEELSKETPEAKANKAFAEMRAKNSKYEKALARAAELKGVSVEDFLTEMENDTIQKKAEKLGTDPELLRRLEQLEAENETYRTAQVQMHLQREFGQVQKDLSVTDKELQEFTSELINRGHNFHDTSTDYVLLYRGMYHDKLVEKERQAWIARKEKSESGATTVGKTGRRGGDKDVIETPEDLDKLLSEFEE